MEKSLTHTVVVAKLQEDGAVLCPKCGVKISPNDETEDIYCILESKLIDNKLEEISILCKNCKSIIKLIGFSLIIDNE
ncbi:MAG: hypothetical protein AC479_07290 [miscellaneous Crenarchaeota group-6 archaeon AD8-1]|nr:MAG: hypothetical protein AC479_07290 [miscellaneous Crenarchaeota group-6 archaeon AD8-1]